MLICRVIGAAISTVKDEKLGSLKLLIVRQASVEGKPRGEPFVAVDTVGAGEDELVFVATGSSAREIAILRGAPVDASIVAIVDSLTTKDRVTFRKEAMSTGSTLAE